jgi:hypothetical protein
MNQLEREQSKQKIVSNKDTTRKVAQESLKDSHLLLVYRSTDSSYT